MALFQKHVDVGPSFATAFLTFTKLLYNRPDAVNQYYGSDTEENKP